MTGSIKKNIFSHLPGKTGTYMAALALLILLSVTAFTASSVTSILSDTGSPSPEIYSSIVKSGSCIEGEGQFWSLKNSSRPRVISSGGKITGIQMEYGGENESLYFENINNHCTDNLEKEVERSFAPDREPYRKWDFRLKRDRLQVCEPGTGRIYRSPKTSVDLIVFNNTVIGVKSGQDKIMFDRPPRSIECFENRYMNYSNDGGKEILSCWSSKCEKQEFHLRTKSCGTWYNFRDMSQFSCTWTKEGLEDIELVSDAGNFIPGPIKNSSYNTRIETQRLGNSWDLEFLPNGTALVTQQKGKLVTHSKENGVKTVGKLDVLEGELIGLMGLAVDPNFRQNKNVYLYYTYSYYGDYESMRAKPTLARISRFRLENDTLKNETVLLDRIPGDIFHAGGRLDIGPDGKLYATSGSAQSWVEKPYESQNISSQLGKILRMNLDGSVPRDNPFKDKYIYSRGHRNPQGLAWDADENLYATEHGPWRDDEVNRIVPGGNYGWGRYQCDEIHAADVPEIGEAIDPISCPNNWTLAPSGAEIVNDPASPWNGKLFVAGLRGSHVRMYDLKSGKVKEESIFYIPRETSSSNRIRDIEYHEGELWVLGDYTWLVRLVPK